MTAQAAYSEMVTRHIVPVLRTAKYRGTAGTYSLSSDVGDIAIVNLQKSKWNTANEVGFTVNLAVIPKPWLEWQREQHLLGATAKPREYHGLWREGLVPRPGLSKDGQFWDVRDEVTADACADDVTGQLERLGLPRLSALLDRSTMIAAIRAGDFGFIKMSPLLPLAVILSDHGPSAELDDTLHRLSEIPGWEHWKLKDEALVWIRDRAAQRRG